MTPPNESGTADIRAPSEDAIEDYLGKHPEFFQGRDELLTKITLPHGTGTAVSLIERQVALLREQNRNYRRQLQNLVHIGRTNDELIARLQQLTLHLLDSTGIEDILDLIEDSLRQDFQAEAATLALFGDFPESDSGIRAREFMHVEVVTDFAGCCELRKLLAIGKPFCGTLDRKCLTTLFGNRAEVIASTAVVPLTAAGATTRPVGLLAIGSESAERFNPEMGTTYLRHLGDLLGRRLGPCLVPLPG